MTDHNRVEGSDAADILAGLDRPCRHCQSIHDGPGPLCGSPACEAASRRAESASEGVGDPGRGA